MNIGNREMAFESPIRLGISKDDGPPYFQVGSLYEGATHEHDALAIRRCLCSLVRFDVQGNQIAEKEQQESERASDRHPPAQEKDAEMEPRITHEMNRTSI